MPECDNGAQAHLGHPIVSPACYRGQATHKMTVYYDKYKEAPNLDTLNVCDACLKVIKSSARKHGYTITSSKL